MQSRTMSPIEAAKSAGNVRGITIRTIKKPIGPKIHNIVQHKEGKTVKAQSNITLVLSLIFLTNSFHLSMI